MKLRILFPLLLLCHISIHSPIYSGAGDGDIKNQPPLVQSALKKEKNPEDNKNLVTIIRTLDEIYGDLYLKLANGKKITIFIDPAHGKLKDGRWQGGEATRRLSCTNKPEEFYSIIISREMYKILKENKFLEVKTTDDFLEVLENRSESYNNIEFETTVELAKKYNAFLIVSEHLNNVSIFHKADGLVNIPGIHITRNYDGRKVLRVIPKPYEGFLTLYNRSDTTGFSKQYALTLKKKLMALGMKPNFWQQGAVGDDRFCYFVDFPISVIYETGFTSNPDEERMLRDPQQVKKIVKSQYDAIIENIRDNFGVDIAGTRPVLVKKTSVGKMELLKLARIAVYYLKKGDTNKSLAAISDMEKKYGYTKHGEFLEYFKFVKDTLYQIQKNLDLGEKYKKLSNNFAQKKNSGEANRYKSLSTQSFREARKYTYKPVFQGYNSLINREIIEKTQVAHNKNGTDKKTEKKPYIIENITGHVKAPMPLPIILPIEDKQSLKDAINNALLPDSGTLKKLTLIFSNARTTTSVLKSRYSEKLKKTISYWARESSKMNFRKGIYIVKLNNKMEIVDITLTDSVSLDPKRYQNQQYLNNSFFCQGARQKEL